MTEKSKASSVSKRRASRRPAKGEARANAVYFTSLTIENIRCFGPPQRLDLADEKAHPAQWTVILGDNGTGKTTLLRSMARSCSFFGEKKSADNFAKSVGFYVESARMKSKYISIIPFFISGSKLRLKSKHDYEITTSEYFIGRSDSKSKKDENTSDTFHLMYEQYKNMETP